MSDTPKGLPDNPSDAFKKRNQHLYPEWAKQYVSEVRFGSPMYPPTHTCVGCGKKDWLWDSESQDWYCRCRSLGAKTEVRPAKKRIRQQAKPLMNKLESEWLEVLKAQAGFQNTIRPQAKRYKLANGVWYRPDFTCSSWTTCFPGIEYGSTMIDDKRICCLETAWECKGPSKVKGCSKGLMTVKFAASQWPEVRFILVWKESGEWKTQVVLP